MSTEIALKVIAKVRQATSKSITGVTFISIRNYTNSSGEIANHLVNVGASYENAKAKDIEYLRNLNVEKFDSKLDSALLETARLELIESFINPSENRSNGQIDAYTHIFSGVKVHNETGKLYIYGYRENKTVIQEGTYKTVNSKPLTIAKNELRKQLRTGKFTQYSLEIGNELRLNGETLEL